MNTHFTRPGGEGRRRIFSTHGGDVEYPSRSRLHGVLSLFFLVLPLFQARAAEMRSFPTDRTFDELSAPRPPSDLRTLLAEAARALGDWRIDFAGVGIDGKRLLDIVARSETEPLSRAMREALGRPVDPADFLYFLDDLLREGKNNLRGESVWVTAGRARYMGILLHPDDIFERIPRRYGERGSLGIDRPADQIDLPPARDGDPPGPNWTLRYKNPAGEAQLLEALKTQRGGGESAEVIRSLIDQLREQGAEVHLTSTVRSPERGYLMWGCFLLSRADSEAQLDSRLVQIENARREWGRSAAIEWKLPGEWLDLREAAREMAETFGVVYATEEGARSSNHYTGDAFDLVAVGLPRQLELRAPDNSHRHFDLSAPDESRDFNLTPELIDWVEKHFGLRKLRSDYPHWDIVGR